jgi:hypothetical protein
MKFLCLTCDAQMNVAENRRQREDGTLAIVLECPECFGQVGMLTNPMETKMLDALDVSVCPVGGKNRAAEAATTAAAPAAASKCPVAGMTEAMSSDGPALEWTDAAERRLANLPGFVRPMIQAGIESFARKHGRALVDDSVMDEARAAMGM